MQLSYLSHDGGSEDPPIISPSIMTSFHWGLLSFWSCGVGADESRLGGNKPTALLHHLVTPAPQVFRVIAAARVVWDHAAVMVGDSGRKILQEVMICHEDHWEAQQNHVDDLETAQATHLLQKFSESHGHSDFECGLDGPELPLA